MQIVELYGLDAAAEARGHVVVIDVLRAFTCAAYAFEAGAESIELVATVEDALARKRRDPDVLVMGHGPGGTRPEGFDFGNSPADLVRARLRGRRLVQRTGSGTVGAVRATRADALYLASLVNASATARHIRREAPTTVSLVALGAPRGPDGPEDVACRDLIAARLRGETYDDAAACRVVASSPAAEELRDASRRIGTWDDVSAAVQVDRSCFAMVVRREGDSLVARRIDVTPRARTRLSFERALRAARWRRTDLPVTRSEAEQVLDELLAAGAISEDVAVLCGGRGPLDADDHARLERVARDAGLVVDDETALVVESLALCRDAVEGRIPPSACARGLAGLSFRIPGVETRWWYYAEHVDECAQWNGRESADREILNLAYDFLREHGTPFGLG